MGTIIRRFFKGIVWICIILGVYSFFFQATTDTDPTAKKDKYDTVTRVIYNSDRGKYYIEKIEQLKEKTNANTADIQSFLVDRGFHDIAKLSIESKKILDVHGQHYIGISSEVLDNFVTTDQRIWQTHILPIESKWDSKEWQRLKSIRQELWKEATQLKSVYDAIPRKAKKNT